MKVIDPGHLYDLVVLDQKEFPYPQSIQYAKRSGWGYPGNVGTYPGTTCQEVLRTVWDRVGYLDGQIPHPVNKVIRVLVAWSVWLFEFRAARRRGRWYWRSPSYAVSAGVCQSCGHTDCRKCVKTTESGE